MRNPIPALLLALALATAPACTTNPATGERQFNLLSLNPQEEIQLGEDAAPQFLEEYGGEIPSPEIQQYVTRIGQDLAAQSERPDLPWEFRVVDSPVINAFALPGGKVFISRGLLVEMDNEAQLAGVLGHEIAHITAQHVGQQMSRGLLLQGLVTGLDIAAQTNEGVWLQALGVGAQVGGGLYLLSFGREQELQADSLGLRYMTRAGYNPVGQLQVLRILREQNTAAPPEFLSTHPAPDSRLEDLTRMIRRRYPGYNDADAYEFYQDRYQRAVLDRLDDLPPPNHQPNQQQQTEQREYQQQLEARQDRVISRPAR